MLAAALLITWWAQAEPAPAAEPPPPASRAAPTTPPLGAAATGPSAPAPLDNAFGVTVNFAHRQGHEGQSIGPANGISVGGDYQRRYLVTPDGLELSGGLDFFYDRFSTDLTGQMMLDPGLAQRVVSQTNFALMQTVTWRKGRLRPFVEVGGGATIAFFSSPEVALRPGSYDAVQPIARGAVGLSVVVYHDVAATLQGMYTHAFTRPVFTASDGTTYSFLGDLLDLGLGATMQF
jgi:hypothetical protein